MLAFWDDALGRSYNSAGPGQGQPLEPLLGSFTIWRPC
jgi:hypothetical protein